MLRDRALKLQKSFKAKQGFVIMRAYYGLKTHIIKHLELNVGEDTDLYWDDRNHRLDEEGLGDLFCLNVTTLIRSNLDSGFGEKGGLNLCSGTSTKQFSLGFFNPIPEPLQQESSPCLLVIFKPYSRSGEEKWDLHAEVERAWF